MHFVVSTGPTLDHVPTGERSCVSGSVGGDSASDTGGESTLPPNYSEDLTYFDAHSEMCKYYRTVTSETQAQN